MRDLESAIERFEEFEVISQAAAVAGVQAYRDMVAPASIDDEALAERLMVVGIRRTLRVPTAAYTDLLSTGNLRVIEDRELRDRIVRFYEEMAARRRSWRATTARTATARSHGSSTNAVS